MQPVHSVVIFGGTGFLGTHLAIHLYNCELAKQIYLVDIQVPRTAVYAARLHEGIAAGRIHYIEHDLRMPIPADKIPAQVPDLIVNLAAVHREGEYPDEEFFATNVTSAETVCSYAAETGCKRIVFTSSISQYGLRDEQMDESSLSTPETPYGISKALAEKVHQIWLAGDPQRRLITIRPGVLFGPGEAANVTRLARTLVKGYFVYVGNQKTYKSGGYIKELCHVIDFSVGHQEDTGEQYLLLNFSMNPTPRLEEYVGAICGANGLKRKPLQIPRWLLLWTAYAVHGITSVFGIRQPITPLRVRKVYRNTFYEPARLRDLGYAWKYTMESAFRDWKKDAPEEFGN